MLVQRIVKNEYNILKDTRRVGQLAKRLYKNKNANARYLYQAKYLSKKVGIEPVIGLALGTFTNPIPGGGAIGYAVGQAINILRKNMLKIIK